MRPNERCWCGSGKKYKVCHRNRAVGVPPLSAMVGLARESFSKELCLYYSKQGCSGPIVKAHTIPRSGSLKQIAVNGQLLRFDVTLPGLLNHGPSVPVKEIGIKNASTFTGFCARHDDGLFAPLEKQRFTGSTQQCFLLGFRATAFEAFRKQCAIDLAKRCMNVFAETYGPACEAIALTERYLVGCYHGMRDLEMELTAYKRAMKNRSYEDVAFLLFRLDRAPQVMCAGGFAPEYDFQRTRLQNMADMNSEAARISFTIFGTEAGGSACLAWMPQKTSASASFCRSLMAVPRERQADTLVRLAFEHLENTYFSPTWWNSLDPDQKKAVSDRILSGSAYRRTDRCLVDDGVLLAPFAVIDYCSKGV